MRDGEVEVFIERITQTAVTFGGRDSGSDKVRQVQLSRPQWEALGKPEGLVVSVRSR